MHVSRGCDACTKAQQPTQRPSVNEPRGGTRCRERQRGPGSASSRGAATIPEKWPALAHSLFFRFAARRDAALCSSTQRFSSDTVRVAAARRLVMLVMSGSIFLFSFFLPLFFLFKNSAPGAKQLPKQDVPLSINRGYLGICAECSFAWRLKNRTNYGII